MVQQIANTVVFVAATRFARRVSSHNHIASQQQAIHSALTSLHQFHDTSCKRDLHVLSFKVKATSGNLMDPDRSQPGSNGHVLFIKAFSLGGSREVYMSSS